MTARGPTSRSSPTSTPACAPSTSAIRCAPRRSAATWRRFRAADGGDPLRPKEVGCYVPELSGDRQAVQSNDIGTDDNGLLYLIDRAGAGMHILEYTG